MNFSIWRILQAKVQVRPHANLATLSQSTTMEWDWPAVEYIRKSCCSFPRSLEAVVAKNGAYIE
jgi:hypothetical protein